MDRRRFIGSLGMLGLGGMLFEASGAESLAGLAATPGRKRKVRGAFDDNLVCIISDLHTNPGSYQPGRLERTVADIVRMKPLPRNVLALGDLAYLTGKPEEYARLKEILAPIEAAGMRLTLAMGNHDRRANFAEAFPSHAAATLVEGRYVYVVETPRADIIVLDSLQESEDPTKWITPGALDDGQKAWLKEKLATYSDKPVFVTSHHPIGEVGIKDILLDSPTCSGYIHGHDHVWRPGWVKKNYSQRDILRTLCVPSTGHWGDIGYTMLDLGEDSATATLHEYEYFFPTPLEDGEPKPAQWDMIEKEHKGISCSFAYKV